MPKKERLNKKADFRKVFKEGKKLSSPHFSLYIRNTGLPSARFASAIAKAHVKLATRRNRLRRVACEEFRARLGNLGAKYDIVMASKKNPGETAPRMTKTCSEVRGLMQKAEESLNNG